MRTGSVVSLVRFLVFLLTLDTLCNQRKPFKSGSVLLRIYLLRQVNYKFTCLDVDGEDGNGLQLQKIGSNSTLLNGLADWFAEMTGYSDVRVKNIERCLPLALVATFIA